MKNKIGFLIIVLLPILFLGCITMARFASAWRTFGDDSRRVQNMSLSDIEKRIDPSIDLTTVKNIPNIARGKFVKLNGKVSDVGLKKAFSFLDDDSEFLQEGEKKDHSWGTTGFMLDESIAIFCADVDNPWMKDGDTVEIIGMVCRSSIFKTQKQGSDDPKIPDYEVVIAKTVKKV